MVNKRLRCNEMIGSFVTAEVSKRINRIVSLGDKATIKDMLNAFRFPKSFGEVKLFELQETYYEQYYGDQYGAASFIIE